MIVLACTNFSGGFFAVGIILAFFGILAFLQARTERALGNAEAQGKLDKAHELWNEAHNIVPFSDIASSDKTELAFGGTQ